MKFPNAALGTMYYGSSIDASFAHRMIDIYVDSGLDLLDTANNYAYWITGTQGGESESTIGDWLRANPAKQVRGATKIGARPRAAGSGLENTEGLAPSRMRSATEGSLGRLGVDHIELLYAHIDDRDVPLEESLGALSAFVDEGLISHYGISNFTEDRLNAAFEVMDARKLHPIAALQQRYSVVLPPKGADVSPHVIASPGVQAVLAKRNVPLVAYSPLIEGALSDASRPYPPAYDTAANRQARVELEQRARKQGLPLSQFVLGKLMANRVVPLLGARSPEQLAESLQAVR